MVMKSRIRNFLIELIAVIFGRVDGATHSAFRLRGKWVVVDTNPQRAGPSSLELKNWTAAYQLRCYEMGMIDALCGTLCTNHRGSGNVAPQGWKRT